MHPPSLPLLTRSELGFWSQLTRTSRLTLSPLLGSWLTLAKVTERERGEGGKREGGSVWDSHLQGVLGHKVQEWSICTTLLPISDYKVSAKDVVVRGLVARFDWMWPPVMTLKGVKSLKKTQYPFVVSCSLGTISVHASAQIYFSIVSGTWG